MSVVQLTPSPSNTRRQEMALLLQPIQAPHPANHRANVVTHSDEKKALPTPTSTFASRPLTLCLLTWGFPRFSTTPQSVGHRPQSPVSYQPRTPSRTSQSYQVRSCIFILSASLDCDTPTVAMSHTRGCPLQRYPKKRPLESNVTICECTTSIILCPLLVNARLPQTEMITVYPV